jgi:hypothetical protein
VKPVRLSRRALLRGGAGIAVGLPLLDAMLDGRGLLVGTANAQPAPPPVRLVTFFFPCGTVLEDWLPPDTGEGYRLSPCLKPLGGTANVPAIRDYVNVLSNLRKEEYKDQMTEYTAESHLRGTGTFATGVAVSPDGLGAGGPSVDQVAVQALKPTTRFPSLALALGKANGVNLSHISWSKAKTPVPPERSPRSLFNKLFSTANPGVPNAELEQLARRRKSVLDLVRGDLSRLQGQVGSNDRARIEEHMESVREIERQLTYVPTSTCEAPEAPFDGMTPPEAARAMLKMLTVALRCDLTRVASFQLFQRQDNLRFSWLGIDRGHHDVSHDTTSTGLAQQTAIVTWEVQLFAEFLNMLKASPEGGGNLLDNSLVFFANEHSIGRSHEYKDMPVLLAGRAGGRMKTGRHIRYPVDTPYSKVFVSMLNFVGVPTTRFGTHGRGPLGGLEA